MIGAFILLVSSTAALVLTPIGNRVAAIWNSPEKLDTIESKVDSLITEVMRVSGEDRVIKEAEGLSYVVEPVYRGDVITLNMVLRKTRTGGGCHVTNRTALFTDETNVATPGSTIKPSRQLSTVQAPVRYELEVPENIRPGRVTVSMSYEFQCGNEMIYETTRPVPFMLLERAE